MRVTRGALDAIVAHARAELPNECCGLLVGTADAIGGAVPARNLRASPTRFLIDPQDHFRALRDARRSGEIVCGAYHSHPRGPSTPSETDLAESHDPSLLHVIVSLAGEAPVVRAYIYRDGRYAQVELVES